MKMQRFRHALEVLPHGPREAAGSPSLEAAALSPVWKFGSLPNNNRADFDQLVLQARRSNHLPSFTAKVGIPGEFALSTGLWIPAFAGMTERRTTRQCSDPMHPARKNKKGR
jgi:hypothetical protein